MVAGILTGAAIALVFTIVGFALAMVKKINEEEREK